VKLNVDSLTHCNAEKLLARSISTYNLPQRRWPIWKQLPGYRSLLLWKTHLFRLVTRQF